jgi:5'(3')-deoxyribonucleotidase
MKKLFFDMDGVLVDFQSGIDKLSDETKQEYEGRLDEVPGIFSLMDPMPGAIEAVHELSKYYDMYILSTAPWKNLTAWSDKIEWLTKHFGDLFKKRVILTHCKHLCDGDYLVDDRAKNGASEFPGEWIQFGSERYPDWEEVIRYLISETFIHDEDDERLNKRLIDYTMVEKTIKMLDGYMELLNLKAKANCTPELSRKVLSVANLTNKWLKVSGEENESAYYID